MPFSKSTAPIYPKIDETSLATNYVSGGVIGHPLSVQQRLHFLHSLAVVDKESGLITQT